VFILMALIREAEQRARAFLRYNAGGRPASRSIACSTRASSRRSSITWVKGPTAQAVGL